MRVRLMSLFVLVAGVMAFGAQSASAAQKKELPRPPGAGVMAFGAQSASAGTLRISPSTAKSQVNTG
jgi:hypothetical protein